MLGFLLPPVLMVAECGQAGPGALGLSRDDVQHSTWFRWGVRDLLTPWGAWSSDCMALQEVHFPFFSYQAVFDFLCIFLLLFEHCVGVVKGVI